MADVINKTTLELRRSVSAPDFDPAMWLIFDQGESGRPPTKEEQRITADVPSKYWMISKDALAEMNAEQKAIVDAAESSELAKNQAVKADLEGAKDNAAQIVQACQTIINGIDSATLAQTRTAIKTLAQQQQILTKGLLRSIERGGF